MPASAVVALVRVGFCSAEVKPFGPVHAYVAPLSVGVDSEIVAPAQYGPPLLAVGVAGIAIGRALGRAGAEVQPFTVMVTEYVPASAAVALARVGVCSEEVKVF